MKIQKDSYIRCKSHDDMVNTRISLEEIGIESEYVEELNGKPGYWLHIIKESGNENQR